MRTISTGAALLTVAVSVGRAQEKPLAYDHAKLLVYRDERGAEHPVKTPGDWQIRRRHVLAGMQQVMGPLPDRRHLPALDVRIDEEVMSPRWTRYKLTYQAEPNDRVPAYLFIPSSASATQKAPAMLALHQTVSMGKKEPAGLGPKSNLQYGLELADRGYVVLVPDYPSFGDYRYDFHADRYVSGTMKGIFNHMRGVDLLAARPEVDPARIGVIGHSLGGHNALFVAAFDDRLQVTVTSCGFTPFHDYYGGKIAGWTSDRYMPRLRDVYGLDADKVPFDFYEVLAAIAPRAVFSNSPLHDDNFDVTGVRKAIAGAQPVFALLGNPEYLQVRYPDSQHDFPPPVRKEAYAFIDKVLRHHSTP